VVVGAGARVVVAAGGRVVVGAGACVVVDAAACVVFGAGVQVDEGAAELDTVGLVPAATASAAATVAVPGVALPEAPAA
jgi:hypothetical protein